MDPKNRCVHCGSDNGKHPVVWKELAFCCHGCRHVYQILKEHQLSKYYSLEQTPGIHLDESEHGSKYSFLDKPEIYNKMYEFHENDFAHIRLYIPAIHCISCVWLLENINRLHPGIIQSSVNFLNKELTVGFNPKEISLRKLVELLVSIHYIPDISLQTIVKQGEGHPNRKLLYKIGVAGFAFGNVMLYSLPEYFNGEPLNESLGTFLYYLGYFLTLPVILYSGNDYLISAYKNLRKGIVNVDLPIAMGIIALFAVTSVEVWARSGPGYSDSLAGLIFFLLLGKWYQNKTYQALAFDRDYRSYFPVAVSKITEGGEESTLLSDIRKGDRLMVHSKELIPADSKLVEGIALIDYSFVTGESTPLQKGAGEVIYAGGKQTSGLIIVEVIKEVQQSHLTQLWNQVENNKYIDRSMKSAVDRVSIWFTLSVITIALAGLAYWWVQSDAAKGILVLSSVLIVACPCALALSLPFTFGSAMRQMGLKGLYIKNTTVIEKMNRIDTIVFDKTGTLTYPDQNRIEFIGLPLTLLDKQKVLSLTQQSIHPLSFALTRHFHELDPLPVVGFVEIPGRGIFGQISSESVKLGSREFVSGEIKAKDAVGSEVWLSINDQLKGSFRISNQYRKQFDEVIGDLQKKYDLFLLSGDNDSETQYLSSYFEKGRLLFDQQPEDKMHFITKLRQDGRNIMMMGDGLNDAGAFLQSDVALSIADDIYHFSPAGDAIIDAGEFSKLGRFLLFARKSLGVVKISFVISFLYNIVGLTFALTGKLSPVIAAVLMPISSISVVAFATLCTSFFARKM